MLERVPSDDPQLVIDPQTGRATYQGLPLSGIVVERAADGDISAMHSYKDGDRSGTWQGWYPGGGERYSGAYFRNRHIGTWREWFPDGSPAVEDDYTFAGEQRSHKRWDETGMLVEHVNDRTAKGIDPDAIDLNGPDVEVDQFTNAVVVEGVPYSGQAITRSVPDDDEAPIVRVNTYLDGRPEGHGRTWYTDGTPKSAGMFSAGHPVGTWQNWLPDGTPSEPLEYSDAGKLIR
ncbi:toxin-antitoxin system YwqK family antitoxin [Nocardia sp. NPDC058518]|uniref:toxin-antitoxin system YwqK family antitoxin n=1 Tax=Nocardia sp. NPDC058518 TaxID=3346534 RepID=UPI00365007CC